MISLSKSNVLALIVTLAEVSVFRTFDSLSFLSIPISVIFLFYVLGTFFQVLSRLSYRALFDLMKSKNLKQLESILLKNWRSRSIHSQMSGTPELDFLQDIKGN